MSQIDHASFMAEALAQARWAGSLGEVPIGAVVVKDGQIIARAHNRREELHDATAHAEVLAIREAGRLLGGWRLLGCTLYVTIEPCPMCAGALWQSRVEHLVYGAPDPKAWANLALHDVVANPGLNHRMAVTGGVLAEEAGDLMRQFFRARRK